MSGAFGSLYEREMMSDRTDGGLLYIAGPMTGYPNYNVVSFERAAEQWCAGGWIVETPFDADSRVWRRHYGRNFDPRRDTCEYGDPLLAEMIAEDFATVCRADAIALLDEWEKSKGASAELLVALNLGKPVYSAMTFAVLDLAPSLSFTFSAGR